jgi:hypothetical protein
VPPSFAPGDWAPTQIHAVKHQIERNLCQLMIEGFPVFFIR